MGDSACTSIGALVSEANKDLGRDLWLGALDSLRADQRTAEQAAAVRAALCKACLEDMACMVIGEYLDARDRRKLDRARLVKDLPAELAAMRLSCARLERHVAEALAPLLPLSCGDDPKEAAIELGELVLELGEVVDHLSGSIRHGDAVADEIAEVTPPGDGRSGLTGRLAGNARKVLAAQLARVWTRAGLSLAGGAKGGVLDCVLTELLRGEGNAGPRMVEELMKHARKAAAELPR